MKLIKFNYFNDENYDNEHYLELLSINDIENYIENYDNINYFNCYKNNLIALPKLPINLIHLRCHCNHLISLPKLPESINIIQCNNN